MDPTIFDSLASTAGTVGALSIVALGFVWREWRKEAAAKDALHAEYTAKLIAIVGDYHEFAHLLDRLADAAESEGPPAPKP